MTESCPVLTPVQRQIADIIRRADHSLAAALSVALEEASNQVADEMKAIGQEETAPPLEYFASVIHQRMYCLICGANPDTFEGGDPDIAYNVIRNGQAIAKHYWSADIEPYPPR
ncbi:hypothetical protein GAO09_03600 [Rhizobiales bacterium RZME27]|uniref:Uncharacterized protein n=1 Tax=Endobacterium cereale TaxID=2663029 RepID=A0A6A8A3M3_9HYPH|nr:hypothetical protein [Endobacterium cereale]MEB2844528.1 hypothetical protein [Endobacterium cereale]MQY45154.1 hypothetical protein [Endobacterium cereale]